MCGSSLQPRDDRGNILALVDRVKARNIRAVSRLITLLENHEPDGIAALRQLLSGPPHSAVIGVTGYPGAGKSTLIDQLVAAYRQQGQRVGVLATDISSPLTGGAILGDRIRMQEHALDRDVFIRSMATRGQHGGLARTTREAVMVLEAAGYDVIVIETIGVGQDEVDILDVAQTVVAVVAPGLGDEVQAMKAGLLEVAHIVVLNKGDLPGADMALRDLREWCPLVLRTVAVKGEGIPELVMAIAEHQKMIDLRDRAPRPLEERQQR
ncbi:MAG: methylmalonyl Co-A mutase-associated GTPase MeaB [Nitrospirota bacterium]